MLYFKSIKTPFGHNLLIAEKNGILFFSFFSCDFKIEKINESLVETETSLLKEAEMQLKAYFRKELKKFSVPLSEPRTYFQKKVREIIKSIPYGKVRTYKEVAIYSGFPNAFRAIGYVCANNPFTIIIPCHRVISSNGSLGGYSAGIEIKKALLKHEGWL